MLQKLTLIDYLLDELQHGLKTCHLQPPLQDRPYPARKIDQQALSESEHNHVAGLMRVNNAGEVAAHDTVVAAELVDDGFVLVGRCGGGGHRGVTSVACVRNDCVCNNSV